jgi:hypothetical protein
MAKSPHAAEIAALAGYIGLKPDMQYILSANIS